MYEAAVMTSFLFHFCMANSYLTTCFIAIPSVLLHKLAILYGLQVERHPAFSYRSILEEL